MEFVRSLCGDLEISISDGDLCGDLLSMWVNNIARAYETSPLNVGHWLNPLSINFGSFGGKGV